MQQNNVRFLSGLPHIVSSVKVGVDGIGTANPGSENEIVQITSLV